jgi:hypothetical protein
MNRLAISASVLALSWAPGLPALAQDESGHDNGMGGNRMGGLGVPMSQGSTFGEDPDRTAIRLIHHEKSAEAIPFVDQAAVDKPTDANVLSYAGYWDGKIGEFGISPGYLRKALAADPDHKAAGQYLEEDYLAMHDMAAANAQLAELVRICSSGCDERNALSKAIADYQPNLAATSPAPAASSH